MQLFDFDVTLWQIYNLIGKHVPNFIRIGLLL